MRPPEFTGGNARRITPGDDSVRRFNEAAGIHRRKHSTTGVIGFRELDVLQ